MNVFLLVCLIVSYFSCAISADNDIMHADPRQNDIEPVPTTAKAVTKTIPESTTPATTSPRIHTTKSAKRVVNVERIPCNGWCFHKSRSKLAIPKNAALDDKLLKTLYLLKSKVDGFDSFPVKVDVNLFADKAAYLDKPASKARSRVLDKNVIHVPTNIFYPYTREAIKKAIIDSGNTYVPYRDGHAAHPVFRGYNPFSFLWNQSLFDNRYFETNPLLQKNMKYKRRSHNVEMDEEHEEDPFTIGHKINAVKISYDDLNPFRRSSDLDWSVSKLVDFLANENGKQRSKLKRKQMQIKNLIEKPDENSMFEPGRNNVQDIIAGLNPKSKRHDTIVIGLTKNARNNIFKWIVPKARGVVVPKSPTSGVVLRGKTRMKALTALLRYMLRTYQFADNTPTYKKIIFSN